MAESIVEWKPRPRNRVYIKLSGGRFFTVPESETLPLKVGSTLSDEQIEQLGRIDQYVRGKEKALRLLSIRPRTRFEIRKALDGIGVIQAIREGIVSELVEQGILDDVRFAREYVRARMQSKHLGPHRLRFDLGKLGVGETIVESVLGEEFSAHTQDELAWDVVRKKLGARGANEADIRRLSGLLRRKGMDYEVINRIMYELLERGDADRPDSEWGSDE